MAKGAGSTRNNTSKSFQWSGIDDFEHVLHDSQEIFKIEARSGLGEKFMQRKPQVVTNEKYQQLLNSGDYIEVQHSSTANGNNQFLNGGYYINNDIHADGYGYYFADRDTAWYGENTVTGLIKKSDIYPKSRYWKEASPIIEKYLGKNPALKNGKPLTSKRDYALASTVAASKGYKIAEGANSFIVIDRSAFITKKK